MRNQIWWFLLLLLSACSFRHQVTISNNTCTSVSKIETLNLSELSFSNIKMDSLVVVEDNKNNVVPSQMIDNNADGIADQILIQISLPPKSSLQYHISTAKKLNKEMSKKERTYCCFVPQRLDDFAWENNKVAFRTYGRACQELFEQGNPSGLISSGIDCWLKRVEYPIIDKWYKKKETGGSYHKDDGEGLDNFDVGKSRGCGGTAILDKGRFIYSENYTEWEILANGPLRSVFRLKYDAVIIRGKPVTEIKTFTIDLGNNFYRCDVKFESELEIDTLAIGLTLHDFCGETDFSETGWISYWEALEDSEIGTGAWVSGELMLGYKETVDTTKNLNQIWLFASVNNNECTYYSGFGWKKAGVFTNKMLWNKYIKEESEKLKILLPVNIY